MRPLRKALGQFLTKPSIRPPYDLAVVPNELKLTSTKPARDITAALFLIAATWKQPRCPPVSDQINIQIIDSYSAIKKRKDLYSYEKIWRNLKFILPSERSHSKKAMYCLILII